MKTTKLFLIGLAALSLTACNNNEEIPNLDNGGTKSVALRFEGLGTSTKAVGNQMSAGKVNLANMTVYFTDGVNILSKKHLTSSDTEWTELTTTGYVFHELPATVSAVQIVGNSEGKTLSEGTVTSLKSSVIKASGEQDFNDVVLFGEDMTLEDGAGDEHVDKVLMAEVNIKPLVARFEIGNIACTDLGTGPVSKFDLNVIGLMNFNSGVTLDGQTASGEYTLANILAPKSPATEGKYIFGETTDDAGNNYSDVSWAWDKITGATITTTDDWNPGENQKFVYQFIPNKLANNSMAQIKLVLDNVVWTDGTNNPFNSIVTAKFQKDGQDLTEFEAGKIYTVDYRFKGENIGPWNPDDVTCVQINVNVANWEVVALTPVFE